tara:strand:- start:246 stop:449 length:204 start_codon:yes stop_codon:yes gene_type:complete
MKLPVYGEPVLAELRHQNSLGESQWYEVVCVNDFGWASYSQSSTFEDGERVISWVYCKEAFNQGDSK